MQFKFLAASLIVVDHNLIKFFFKYDCMCYKEEEGTRHKWSMRDEKKKYY